MNKTFTLILLAGALVAGSMDAAAEGRAGSFSKKRATERVANKIRGFKALAPKAEANMVYKPCKEQLYVYMDGEWIYVTEAVNTYDNRGLVASSVETDVETAEKLRVNNTYNDRGQVIESIFTSNDGSSSDWVNSERRLSSYDNIVTSFKTSSLYYYWRDQAWNLAHGNEYVIDRNDRNSVVEIVRKSPYGQTMDITAKVQNTIGQDGATVVASSVDELKSNGMELYWEKNIDLRNIVWQNTDNQVMNFDIEDYAIGSNRIKSAESYFEDEIEGTVTGSYSNDFEGSMTIEFFDESKMTIGRSYTDNATGSYMETFELAYPEWGEPEDDLNGDGIVNEDDAPLIEMVETEYYIVNLNDKGDIVLEQQMYIVNGDVDFVAAIKYSYEYDDNDCITKMESAVYDMETDEYVPEMRTVYSDYVAVAGIAGVDAAAGLNCSVNGRSAFVTATGESTLEVTALDGRTVLRTAGVGSYSVDLSALPSGVYVLAVAGEKAAKTLKVAL